jgi:hypothetical protein
MSKRFPITPSHPERICWGCDRYCAAQSMVCGNGTIRTPHPMELFGDDWNEWTPPKAASAEPDEARSEHADQPG